jgi:hypothetical protein
LSSWSSFIKNFKNLNCTFTNRKALSTNTSTSKTFSSLSSFEFEEDKEEEEEEEVTPLKLMKADSSCSRRCLSKNSSEINSSVSSVSSFSSSVRFLLVKISDIFFSNCAFLSTIFESRTRRRREEEEEVSSSSSSSSFSERRDALPMMDDDFSSLLLRKRKREKIERSLFRVFNPIVFEKTKEASALSLSGAFFHIDEFVIKSRMLGELREHIIVTFFVRSREKRPLF